MNGIVGYEVFRITVFNFGLLGGEVPYSHLLCCTRGGAGGCKVGRCAQGSQTICTASGVTALTPVHDCRLGHKEQKDEWMPRLVETFQRGNVLPPTAVLAAGSAYSAATSGTFSNMTTSFQGCELLVFFSPFIASPQLQSTVVLFCSI